MPASTAHLRWSAAYRRLVEQCRQRVARGEWCWFYRRAGHELCPGPINLALDSQHRDAYTMHHLVALQHGGAAVPPLEQVAPAHRGCNSRQGRYDAQGVGPKPSRPVRQDPTSRDWL